MVKIFVVNSGNEADVAIGLVGTKLGQTQLFTDDGASSM